MKTFPKTTVTILGLLAAVTTVGVYGASAGGSVALERPKTVQADTSVSGKEDRPGRVVRIVGPQFFPDNGDIKLHGAGGKSNRRQ
ncbi:hypothetical protein LAV84_00425 [Rhizobium sp. VS19-DR104.2]|uniref:hypothetical protein n=1 Tax=unclassified Rhizobium TaxID=2613769 RepID=UPI001C5BBA95|nr:MULTISPECIES: hypothetical protein [unclassified Rhizobium]MBZ5758857.1 hypothetical protein [Rhizobium sp. VS19-DR96]MBZ5764313.1 hypothetical protein [Rhizobium sp. VS19-DR129.2]MBZ5771856.1 hypothetical protein [Rhizobium sp. VS19-DRK62.2]MBZ5783457.1 hypothetical protein [Rhizobium sp. VS19-DR121]MBZ5800905.1 hypothetical protein [Rhizobium sp. VS19-DR181]